MEFDSQKMLNLYIYDHLVKRDMHITAESFAKEADLHPESFDVLILCHVLKLFSYDVQTTQNAGSMPQNVNPILPVSGPGVNFAMQMPDFANLLPTVCPTTILRPDIGILLQNSASMVPSTIPRLNMRNSLQNAFSMMPQTKFNPVTAITHINMVELQTKTKLIAARMSEKKCLRPPARDIYSNINLIKVNKLAPVLPSSSSLSQPQKKNNKKRKISATRDDNIGTGLEGSTSVELTLPTPAKRVVQNNIDHADTVQSDYRRAA
ncbi:hypothetical protein CDL12_19280 [Handroanthus impetiginosus]|uniref:Uncharacterized protein n=1 Tax=Handroanthus impetiginosus TaxID=429701 RepID=A0A2G9GSF9_9LAMI|nr:hypothetical protein CDL12_19280 [Handroanthus impetiginosus]